MNIKKTLTSLIVGVFAVAFSVSSVFAVSNWFQGFETDTDGWLDSDDAWYGTVTRTASGANGITSSDGSWHAIMEGDASSGPFSRFDMYRNTWPGTWVAELDVYLAPSWAAGTGFDYSVAATGSDGNHQRDYIFHVTKDTSTGDLLVAGSNNTNFAPREDLENINHYVIPSAGWYTLQHVFRDQGGALAVDLNLLDSSDTVVFTETRYSAADTIPGEVGGNRYSWFTFINVDGGIAVDNHELYTKPPEVVSSINGGGHLLNGAEDAKRKDLLDVSFGGRIELYDNDSLSGEWNVVLHNVGDNTLDKSKFHGADVTEINFFDGDGLTCNDAVNFTVNGTFNREPASMIFRAGDFGSPNTMDTARVTIYDDLDGTGNVLYDTFESGEFGGGSTCVGSARTGIDNGNITINQ